MTNGFKSVALFTCCILMLASCDANKAPQQKEEKSDLPEYDNVSLYLTSRESTDSLLCSKDSVLQTECGIEDFYFTLKGNVIQREYCKEEQEAAWIIGKYRIGDSGIVCQMDKAYIVTLAKAPDTTNYNRGRYFNLERKEPFLIAKSACNGFMYTRPYEDWKKAMLRKTISLGKYKGPMPFGRVYYTDKVVEEKMLLELRKVKPLIDL